MANSSVITVRLPKEDRAKLIISSTKTENQSPKSSAKRLNCITKTKKQNEKSVLHVLQNEQKVYYVYYMYYIF